MAGIPTGTERLDAGCGEVGVLDGAPSDSGEVEIWLGCTNQSERKRFKPRRVEAD